jgi:hypothetical protein
MSSKQVTAVKHASHPMHTFKTEEWNKFKGRAISSGRILIGHNRKATQGSISSENAHPFVEENIILVHNGTLRGHKSISDKEVDSHAVCHAFAEKGAEEVLPTIDGAFAFVWWDTKKEKLYTIRNDERPLSFVVTEDVISIASEEWMPRVLFSRSGKKIVDVVTTEPGVLYEFSIGGKLEEKVIKLKQKEPEKEYAWPHGLCGDGCNDNVFTQRGSHRNGNVMSLPRKPNILSTTQEFIEDQRAANLPAVLQGRSTPGKPIDPHFKQSEEITVRFDRFRVEGEGRVKAFGSVRTPGKPNYDVVCFLPPTADIAESEDWQGVPVRAKVSGIHESSCGKSLWVHTPYLEEQVQTNSEVLSKAEWAHVCTNLKCSTCTAVIYESEAEFTTVTRLATGGIRVICADCVEEKILPGVIKNEFTKRRNAALEARDSALQGGQSISQELIVGPDGKVGTPSPQTLH